MELRNISSSLNAGGPKTGVPSEDIEAPESLKRSEPIWIGKTFSGGRIEGGCADEVRPPARLCELCEEIEGWYKDGRGVEPEDWPVLLLVVAVPVPVWKVPLEPAGSSEEGEPSSGDI